MVYHKNHYFSKATLSRACPTHNSAPPASYGPHSDSPKWSSTYIRVRSLSRPGPLPFFLACSKRESSTHVWNGEKKAEKEAKTKALLNRVAQRTVWLRISQETKKIYIQKNGNTRAAFTIVWKSEAFSALEFLF